MRRSVPRATLAGALGALLVTAVCAPLAGAAEDETTLVSRQSAADGGAGGDDDSSGPSISADGRFIAFNSIANNLSDVDDDERVPQDIFVRDLETNTTELVSRQSAADGGAGADSNSVIPSISADGRFVVFQSGARNLSDADDDNATDVFIRDLETDTTELVSRQSAADGGAGGDDGSFARAISADGRFVAFDSFADNLSGADSNAATNVYVRDRATDTTTLVSRQSAGQGGAGGNEDSFDAAISADGGFVAFSSEADNLSGADNDGGDDIDVFVRDVQAATTTLVSRRAGGGGGNAASFLPSMSADGDRVAFASDADNLSGGDSNAVTNAFVRDIAADTTTLVSRQSAADGGAGANDASDDPAISADGRFVGFGSLADNLSTEDRDAFENAFVRDLRADTTTLVSRQSAADGNAAADADSTQPVPSADGRFVAFDSEADNLSALDTDSTQDVFIRDVLGPGGGGGGGGELTVELRAKKRQRAGKPVKVKATCSADCTVETKGRAKRKGRRKLKLKRAEAELTAGETQKLRLKPSRKVARKLRRAGKAKARITAKATDGAGNEATDRLKVKLRRKKR
jgi:Tol biopolymer transport system component